MFCGGSVVPKYKPQRKQRSQNSVKNAQSLVGFHQNNCFILQVKKEEQLETRLWWLRIYVR